MMPFNLLLSIMNLAKFSFCKIWKKIKMHTLPLLRIGTSNHLTHCMFHMISAVRYTLNMA